MLSRKAATVMKAAAAKAATVMKPADDDGNASDGPERAISAAKAATVRCTGRLVRTGRVHSFSVRLLLLPTDHSSFFSSAIKLSCHKGFMAEQRIATPTIGRSQLGSPATAPDIHICECSQIWGCVWLKTTRDSAEHTAVWRLLRDRQMPKQQGPPLETQEVAFPQHTGSSALTDGSVDG
jgi:hypothetical protein